MKKYLILLLLLIILISHALGSSYYINDGESHLIDHQLYHDDNIFIDHMTDNDPGTEVHVVEGGQVGFIAGYMRSNILIDGGTVSSTISIFHNSTATITRGIIGDIFDANSDTIVNMSGGTIGNSLNALGNASVTLSGGTIGNYLQSFENGSLYLIGNNFQVTAGGNTYDLSYGDKLSDFGLLETAYGGNRRYIGTITGTLQDGSLLNNTFRIWNMDDNAGTADIYIVPEPATLSLLALGGLALLRKRKYQ